MKANYFFDEGSKCPKCEKGIVAHLVTRSGKSNIFKCILCGHIFKSHSFIKDNKHSSKQTKKDIEGIFITDLIKKRVS